MIPSPVRVGVVGAGRMGADHISRLTHRISGAHVTAIVDTDPARARAASRTAPGSEVFPHINAAIAAGAMDAVLIATPGPAHEESILPGLAHGLPILCEKPLTEDPDSSYRILEAEQQLDQPHIQVGFTRRFDEEYLHLQQLITSGRAGELLMLHCVHRNRDVPEGYRPEMLIADSVVHELDAAAWLAGASVRNIRVHHAKRNSLAPPDLREPILVVFELTNDVLVDVEMNVNCQFGYQITTEAVFEQGAARIGDPGGIQVFSHGAASFTVHRGHSDRLDRAFDTELQTWINAVADGRLVDGPNAWDGYQAARACEAGVRALVEGVQVEIPVQDRPDFYSQPIVPEEKS